VAKDANPDMDPMTELDATPEPFFQRRSTRVVGFFAIVGLVLFAWWYSVHAKGRNILAMGARGQCDSAWAELNAWQGPLYDCSRWGLAANLAAIDSRADTLLLRMVDSLTTCHLPEDSLLKLVSLANLRLASRTSPLDTSDLWRIQGTAFRAASDCVRVDSTNRTCFELGFKALVALDDSFGQSAWIGKALERWPGDTGFLGMKARIAPPQDSSLSGRDGSKSR